MKPWTRDFIAGIVIAVGLGATVALYDPSSLLFWVAGLCCGYGLRIGIVNVWPHIFQPRIAYKQHREN